MLPPRRCTAPAPRRSTPSTRGRCGRPKDLGGDDDPEFLPSVLRSFLSHLGTAVADLDAAVARRDSAAVKRAAHSLKGGAGNVGARTLATLCAAVEHVALAGGDLARPLADVHAEATRVRARVDAELSRDPVPWVTPCARPPRSSASTSRPSASPSPGTTATSRRTRRRSSASSVRAPAVAATRPAT